ncbi:methyl-accepting chemotaxis protein [Paenibacillus flagellatus]|uniref:Methyl-accepting transducer domain-containing protein n=1 Tax=Paenibacillus flagellatus TaxID=2211139 RepID=A0A2V5JWX3_9BACL|nr:methyl-accepting chemotaxis protein [Paenibacillus flagellatus]PYI51111.1 hypothetical protein DLM86_25810 [Paenibacillus flagellatus]
MDVQQTIKLQVMRRKNGVVFVALAVTCLLALASVVAFSGSAQQAGGGDSGLVIGLLIGLLAVFGLLHFTKRFPYALPYVAIIGNAAISFGTGMQSESMSNILGVFYGLVLAGIYMSLWPTVVSIAVNAALLAYFVSSQGDVPGIAGNGTTIFIYYALVCALLIAIWSTAGHLAKQMEAFGAETGRLLARQKEDKEKLLEHAAAVSSNMTLIAKASEENNASFVEMNTAFHEIASGANSQVDSTLSINRSVQETGQKIGEMLRSLELLKEKTSGTSGRSMEGGDKMDHMFRSTTEFQHSIESMSKAIAELTETLGEVTRFNESIQQIAQQTNILSLNAGIEAARAGESGRGFAVVAQEIRKLAEMTGRSAEEISEKLGNVSAQAEATSGSMNRIAEQMKQNATVTLETRQAFQEINASIAELDEMTNGYHDMMQSIRTAASSIQESTEHFAAVSEQSSATLEELSATVETLLRQNMQLRQLIQETDGKIKEMVQ